ncbi:S9 family peptidase [Chroococcus sp. FPU101]|uniref:S9 family peptidase n=1 Tax=Chroococcus sp. FPU101 TaxID=1974212 RepID=UPI001A909FF8|nr:S9 family peptidase [Chroococcus sp. FPU101]GFE69514.1 peptidase S9 prolyl oligopeptidase active site domain protein [Chroococcus sp. FPU101]
MQGHYGSWKSPITSDLIVAETISLSEASIDRNDVYWLEGRPSEGGRNVLVKHSSDGEIREITPQPYNIRTRVHEYGGGSYLVSDGIIYFVNYADQQIYRQQVDTNTPQPLTTITKLRYADLILDKNRDRLICVCEDHTDSEQEPENYLASIDLQNGTIKKLAFGADFYTSPRLSPDGNQLAWIEWNHPHMPWDESQLWRANFDKRGNLENRQCLIANIEESICEPRWSPDGYLYFSSDHTLWWNLYRYQNEPVSIYQTEAEFAYPHWIFGISTYGFINPDKIACIYTQNGRWYLALIDLKTQQLQPINLPYTNIFCLKVQEEKLVFIGSSPTQTAAIIQYDFKTQETTILKNASELTIDLKYISCPEAIAFPTDNGLTAYAWYYPPKNSDYQLGLDEKPPLLVKSHGGPTAAASVGLNLRIQYWTSRGFGYLDVNYGGSTGYGRSYRQRLDHNWGIVDVQDCINGAKYLVKQGKVDENRLAISGGSAGGYTTLAALTFHDTFKAGASYYGVSDLEILCKDTHKFESRYLDRLIGLYPAQKEIYVKRSPIHFIDRLSCPVIFFQGLEDKVVPPNQAEIMVKALRKKGLPVAYVPFVGEQHGFRRAETIKKALDGEYYFYSRIFGFSMADTIDPIEITNLT